MKFEYKSDRCQASNFNEKLMVEAKEGWRLAHTTYDGNPHRNGVIYTIYERPIPEKHTDYKITISSHGSNSELVYSLTNDEAKKFSTFAWVWNCKVTILNSPFITIFHV